MFRAESQTTSPDYCPDCPQTFTLTAEYPVEKMRRNQAGRLEGCWRQKVRQDFHYRYYAVVRSAAGVDGPPSQEKEFVLLREIRE